MIPLEISLPSDTMLHRCRKHLVSSVADWERIIFGLSSFGCVDQIRFVDTPTSYRGFAELVDYTHEMGFEVVVDASSIEALATGKFPPFVFESIDSIRIGNNPAVYLRLPDEIESSIREIADINPRIRFDVTLGVFHQLSKEGKPPIPNLSVCPRFDSTDFFVRADGELIRRADGVKIGSLIVNGVEAVFSRKIFSTMVTGGIEANKSFLAPPLSVAYA